MPVNMDWSLVRYEDGVVNFGMDPPQAVGGWGVTFTVTKRFGSDAAIMTKSMASGFVGVSGITMVNSGQGQFNINIWEADTSGLQPGNYACRIDRTDSGNKTLLTQGYLLLRE